MSKLLQEVRACMIELRQSDQALVARFCFPATFVGFKGHFPGKPILPGVCKLQAILCILEAHSKKAVKLKEIVSAKFFVPVTCGDELVFTLHQLPEGSDAVTAKALVSRAGTKVADIHIRASYEA